jgi:hypothetical protein
MNIVFDEYEYPNSPACKLTGLSSVVERLIRIDVFPIAIIIILFVKLDLNPIIYL